MFIYWFIRVFERMHGRKLVTMIAANSGGEITERTLRNWIGKRTTPDTERVRQLRRGGRAWLVNDLASKGWSSDECEAFANGLDECPGFLSSFAFSMHAPYGQYPSFLERAGAIDLLDQKLTEQRERGNLKGWVDSLLGADWIRDEHLTHPDDIASGADPTRRQLYEARSWEELSTPLAVILINTQLQLLATLDLEFCSRYLSGFEATPIFSALLPRIDPRVDLSEKSSVPMSRDLNHYPVRRLLETIACMRSARYERKWPQKIPTVENMAVWLQLADQENLANNLVKWRTGRAFTIARFLDTWEACFHFLPEEERAPAPMPMMYAATVFTEMFVKGTREERDLTFMSPDPALYGHWWDIQHRELTTGPAQLRFGNDKWMPGLL